MFLMLVLIWTNPDVTADRLLFNGLWTAWMLVGLGFEERDLAAEFGEGRTNAPCRCSFPGAVRSGNDSNLSALNR